MVQTGASFVHRPDQKNRIAALIDEWGWRKESAGHTSYSYVIEGVGEPKEEVVKEA
jgi:hypothetical protein